ncbi:MAG: IS110 family transposase [Burkholderiales bacterium]
MEVLVSRGCGLDVHQATVVGCLLVGEPGTLPRKQVKTFSTMTSTLIELRDWLKSEGCTAVAMEATGVYWKPVYNILEGHFELVVANARHIKAVPGRKTDVKDAEWIADLLRHGLLQPSYVPPPELRELRLLLRYRVKLVNARSAERNRIIKLLESANIKISGIVSDVFGVSGRLMLDALKRGHATPEEMAELAKKRLRSKIPLLKLALDGRMEAHHRQLLSIQLDRLDRFEGDLRQLDAKLEVKLKPYARQMELLDGIPGIDWFVAATIIAEMGIKMSQWPTVGHLTSWAGLCPGQNESAGKRRNSSIRPGNPYLRSALVEAALTVTRGKNCYFREKYYRLKARRGHKRAVVAIAHKILVAIYYVLSSDTAYQELGADYLERLEPERLKLNLVRRLERLGYQVKLEPNRS